MPKGIQAPSWRHLSAVPLPARHLKRPCHWNWSNSNAMHAGSLMKPLVAWPSSVHLSLFMSARPSSRLGSHLGRLRQAAITRGHRKRMQSSQRGRQTAGKAGSPSPSGQQFLSLHGQHCFTSIVGTCSCFGRCISLSSPAKKKQLPSHLAPHLQLPQGFLACRLPVHLPKPAQRPNIEE